MWSFAVVSVALIGTGVGPKVKAVIRLEALIQRSCSRNEVSPPKWVHGKESILTGVPVGGMVLSGRVIKNADGDVFFAYLSNKGYPWSSLAPYLC